MSTVIINQTIKEAVPYVFDREVVKVDVSTPMDHLTKLLMPTLFFSDGIVVTENNSLVGRIGGEYILKQFCTSCENFWSKTAQDIMEPWNERFTENSQLWEILKVFRDTRFAFVPILGEDNSIIATVSVRDVLPLAVKEEIEIPASSISSKLYDVFEEMRIDVALEIMFNKKIRTLGIHSDNHEITLINDGILIEALDFLKNLTPDPLKVQLHTLKRISIKKMDTSITISEAARLLLDKNWTCVVLDHKIITAWDIVSKTLISKVSF